MKNHIALPTLVVLSLGTWLVAQRPPPGPPEFARPNTNAPGAFLPSPAPLGTNEVEEMLRALRRAMTNAPAAATNPTSAGPSGAQTNVPAVAAPAPAVSAISSAPTVAVPTPVLPQSAPGIVAPVAAVASQQGPLAPLTGNPPAANVQGQAPPTGLPPVLGAPVQQPAPGVVAPAQQPVDRMIQKGLLQLQGMSLDQFFEIYAMVSGRTVLRPYQIQARSQQLTLKAETDWTRQEAIYAMDTVLALNQVAMIPVGDKFVKAVPFAEAALEGAELGRTNVVFEGRTNFAVAVEGEQFVTRMIELKTVKPTELAQLLATFTRPNGVIPFDANNTIVLRDYASNVKRMLDIVEKVDVLRESDYKLEVIPIKYGKVGDLYDTMSSLITGQASTAMSGATGGAAAGRSAGRGGTLGRGAGMGSSMGGYGQQSQYRQPGSYYPQAAATMPATAGGAQSSFQQRLQQIVSRAAGGTEVQLLQDARIVPDLRSNTLLIFANKRDIEMITNIVAKVDVLLAQVLIEAIIMEVQLTDSQNLGVSMLQNPRKFGNSFTGAGGVNNGQGFLNNITNLSSGLPSGFSYFSKLGSDLDVTVNAIAANGTVNVISRPRVQTSHAIPGEFVVAEQVPYVTGSYSDYYGGFGGGGGLGTRSVVQTASIGIQLYVTPFITPEGLVVMEIEQHASQRGADVTIDGNPIPVVNERSAGSTLTVRDGQSIMMGGFITESRNKNSSGVPILKDIPGLGALFRSKNRSNNRSELVILMKATVLRSPEIAAEVAAEEKSQLLGVEQAEAEFKKDDQKRLQKKKALKTKPTASDSQNQATRTGRAGN